MIRVGVAGWSYPDWVGPVYPRAQGRGLHPLEFLAPFLGVLEVNSSFYAVPRRAHVERWALIATRHPQLDISAKLPRDLTHGAWSAARSDLWVQSCAAFEPLAAAGRLRCWLAQFPFSFRDRPAGRAHLEGLSALLGASPWVLEVRHRSWFTPEALVFLRGLGCSLAAIDLPFAPDHPPQEAAPLGRLGYLRLHGRNAGAWFDPRAGRDARYDYRYPAGELEGLAERVRRIAAATERTLVVANNHYGGKALAAALELSARLEGRRVPAPETIVEAFPDLAPWVSVREQPGRQRGLFEGA